MNNVPTLVLELANSRKPKRPSGTRAAYRLDPFETMESLHAFMKQVNYPLPAGNAPAPLVINLDEIKIVRETIEQIVSHLADKKEFRFDAVATLNESAKHCCWIHQLTPDGGCADVSPSGTLAGMIASLCVIELAKCDFTRIKICCRPPCGHYFYDTTRNRSALWHAENPCGWRARSERRK
ncbi:MAG: CGNR zinc finger domain-containing protein [Negativicutes bacterium]|nr:CGNR zinc finger domain-containing protein [Negativicutes bacterium]